MTEFEFKGHGDQRYSHLTYSQCGEDIMVMNLLELIGLHKAANYLDVGAHHPHNISNTALLHQLGMRGVNIEANPRLMEDFKKYRPEDKNLNIGIALEKGVMDFHMWDDQSGRNTFSQEWKEKLEKYSHSIQLPVDTLNNVVDEHCGGVFPDFMSLDIEGLDLPVLQSVDFSKSQPKIICVESWDADTPAIKAALGKWGYFEYSRHCINLIFVHNDYKELVY